MKHNTLFQRLEKAVKEFGYSNIEQALNITSTLLNTYKENKVFPFLETHIFLTKNNLSYKWFFYGEGNMLLSNKDEKTNALLNINAKIMQHHKIDSKDDVLTETIKSDTMEPTIRQGSTVLIDLKNGGIEEDGIYAIHIDGEIKIRRISKRLDGRLDVITDNKKYTNEIIDIDTLNIIGRVVSIFVNIKTYKL